MDIETLVLASALIGVAAYVYGQRAEENVKKKEKTRKRRHSCWVKEWREGRLDHRQQNTFFKLQRRIRLNDPTEFRKMLRMSPALYDKIVEGVRPYIQKSNTNFRKAISVEERVSITLYFLASGAKIRTLQYAFLIGMTTARRILHETTRAIYKVFAQEYLKTPRSPVEWESVSRGFQQRWQYPGCIGAVDGKHVRISKPPGAGSLYYNYKDYHSVVMMVVADANYEIIYISVGSEGRLSDGGIWKNCDLFDHLNENPRELPEDRNINGKRIESHFVGDDAFGLCTRLMKPFSKRALTKEEDIFNYRLSRARRIVENVFGIMASRFQVLQTSMRASVRHINFYILACAVLHNMLRRECGVNYIRPGNVDQEDANGNIVVGDWRGQINLVDYHNPNHNHGQAAKDQRLSLMSYFCTEEGEVPWQYNRLGRLLEIEQSRQRCKNV